MHLTQQRVNGDEPNQKTHRTPYRPYAVQYHPTSTRLTSPQYKNNNGPRALDIHHLTDLLRLPCVIRVYLL